MGTSAMQSALRGRCVCLTGRGYHKKKAKKKNTVNHSTVLPGVMGFVSTLQ